MLKVTLKRSVITNNKKQRGTVKALGLGKIGSVAIQPDNDCIRGMIRKVNHLVVVEQLNDPAEEK